MTNKSCNREKQSSALPLAARWQPASQIRIKMSHSSNSQRITVPTMQEIARCHPPSLTLIKNNNLGRMRPVPLCILLPPARLDHVRGFKCHDESIYVYLCDGNLKRKTLVQVFSMLAMPDLILLITCGHNVQNSVRLC